MQKTLISLALSTACLSMAAHADPIAPKSADEFVGKWQIAFQDHPDVIVNVPDASCDNPATIHSVGEGKIDVSSPKGNWGQWEVTSFDGRNPWHHLNAQTGERDGFALVSVWRSDDSFILAERDPSGIRYDYDNAKQWTRCESE